MPKKSPSARASTRARRNQMTPKERAAKPSYAKKKAASKRRPKTSSK